MTPSGLVIMAIFRPSPTLLKAQVGSLRAQTRTDWECLVGIDGRDPRTLLLLRELIDGDPRFEIREYEANVGHYRNFARLAEAAAVRHPGWVAFADQDDDWRPTKFEQLVPLLGGEVTGVTGQAQLVGGATTARRVTARKQVSLLSLLLDNQVTGSTSVFRGDVLERACPLPDPREASYHDHWFGVVSASMGQHLFVNDVVQDYVQHSANVLGEEMGGRIVRRTMNLVSGRNGAVRSLVDERWGWRVEMARELRTRIPAVRDRADLAAVAKGDFSMLLLRGVVRGVVRREVPTLRGASLTMGAVLARTTNSSIRGVG